MMVKTLFAGVCLLGLGDGAFFTQKAVASQQSPQALTAEVCRILRYEYNPADYERFGGDALGRVGNILERPGAVFDSTVEDAFDVAFKKVMNYCSSIASVSSSSMKRRLRLDCIADGAGGLVAVINRIRWDAAEESVRLAAQAMLEGEVRNQWYPEMRHIMEKYQ